MIINKTLSLFLFIFLSYLILGTGIQGDDLTEIVKMSSMTFEEYFVLSPELHGHYVFGIPAHYILFWAYKVFDISQPFAFEILKILFNYLCIFMVFKFFCQYLKEEMAILIALIFILIPIHDATTYWFMALVYVIPPSLLMYSDYLFNQNRMKLAFAANIVGATFFYTSVPFSLAFSFLNLVKKERKKFLFFILPSIIYVIYYITLSLIFTGIERKISYELTLLKILKNLIGQFLTLIDSNIGISFFLKIFSSIKYLDLIGFLISVFLIILIWINKDKILYKKDHFLQNCNELFILGIASIVFSSMIFVISNRYFQSTFNLGNRTLIYSSIILSLLIARLLNKNKKVFLIGCSCLIFATIGNSNFWKYAWNSQSAIIYDIRANNDFENLPNESLLIVTGNGYIQQGMIDNIEFLIMPWNLRAIFSENPNFEPIFASSTIKISDEKITNLKFNETYKINGEIFIYDSISNTLTKSSNMEVSDLINSLEPPQRHWIQIIDNNQLKFLTEAISPRLSYLFKKN